MDSMELEREKGITIQSAATFTTWKDHQYNIVDTPGHVDFTIEVERALRVLDGAILVLCGVSGVQSQSLTVDRQMRRYNVPRITFINKLDRTGACPWRGIASIRDTLGLNAAAVQIPIGAEAQFEGVVDLLEMKALYFDGPKGEVVREEPVPKDLEALAEEKRSLLLETIADIDEEVGELFLMEEEVDVPTLKAAIRRQTIALKFVPVFMGSAFKNKGVQPALDGVNDYLPDPTQVENRGLNLDNNEEEVVLKTDDKEPFVALAFKLEEGKFGQLTYMRVYQGKIKKGDMIMESVDSKKVKVPRVVRMHSNEMEDVDEIGAGEIAAMFGVDCASGTTFVGNKATRINMTSMHVPEPVISMAIKPKDRGKSGAFGKALAKFIKEDPTFKMHFDNETSENIISGMGELHLEVYKERLFREYGVETEMGQPRVNYRETVTRRAEFEYLHKKQSGGSGQYGKVIGYIEPIPEEEQTEDKFEFINGLSGNNIPPEYVAAIEKGFMDATAEGALAGAPVQGVRFVIMDGQAHSVDSSELAFRTAACAGFRQAYAQAGAEVLEPIMKVEVEFPSEFQSGVVGGLNRRKGVIESVTSNMTGVYSTVKCAVPLQGMFGYSTELRSLTEGKGEYSMEYTHHAAVTKDTQATIHKAYLEKRAAKN